MTLKKYLTKKNIFLFCVSQILISCGVSQQKTIVDNNPWETMQSIIDGIKTPSFIDKKYLITDYGAKPDGIFNNTNAFKESIQACSENGGGVVVVPSGKY